MIRRIALLVCLALPLAACQWSGSSSAYQGYVEGDYVRVAPDYGGRLIARPVRRGDSVTAGAVLFSVDDQEAKLRLSEATARLAQGEAQKASAAANLSAASKDYDRIAALNRQNVYTPAQLDVAAQQRDMAEANLAAAERNVAALIAARDLAQTVLDRHTVRAPQGGRVDDVYFEPGETVAAGLPVVSLLPPGSRRILFFVPETDLDRIAIGDRVAIACDKCPDGLAATVSVIASEAEFTPPVIFSRETRAKLVYRIEARPDGAAAEIKIGQPVDVTLTGTRGSN